MTRELIVKLLVRVKYVDSIMKCTALLIYALVCGCLFRMISEYAAKLLTHVNGILQRNDRDTLVGSN